MRSIFSSLRPDIRSTAIRSAARSTSRLLIAAAALLMPAVAQAQGVSYAGAQTALTATVTAPVAIALDTAGNRYILNHAAASITEVSAAGVQTSILVAPVTISDPRAIAVDADANLYIADYASTHIVKVPAGGGASVSLGSGLLNPTGIALDSAGNVYVADSGHARVVKIPVNSQTTTQLSGSSYTNPVGVAFDSFGNLYVSDIGAQIVSKISFAGSLPAYSTALTGLAAQPYDLAVNQAGDITVSGGSDHAVTTYGINGAIRQIGTGLAQPEGVTIDTTGKIYVADQTGPAIDIIAPGSIDLGQANLCPAGGAQTAPCSQSATLHFNIASGVSLTGVSARVLTQGGESLDFTPASTGNTCTGSLTGPASCALTVNFAPLAPGVRLGAVDISGVSGSATSAGLLATVALHGLGIGALGGFDAGVINSLPISLESTPYLNSVIADSSGNLFFIEGQVPPSTLTGSCLVKKFVVATGTTTTVAGSGSCGAAAGDNGPATSATFKDPWRLAINGRGDLFISDDQAAAIRKVDAVTGIITTVAGTLGSAGHSADGTVAASAQLSKPFALAFDGAGDLYFTDTAESTVRRIDAVSGTLTTVAGNYNQGHGFSGDGGAATAAQLDFPIGLALDSNGNIFIDDDNNNVIREVMASTGIITTFAGTPLTAGYTGDGAAAASAELNDPEGIAIDAAGNLYIADSSNYVVRKVNAGTGIITTVGGAYTTTPIKENAGDGGPANQAAFSYVQDVATDSSGNFYTADSDSVTGSNNVIREIDAASGVALFGSYDIGTASPATDVVVTNNGNAALTLSNLLITPNFNIGGTDTTCTTTSVLNASASCVLGVEFLPNAGGALTGTITVTDDAVGNPTSTQVLHLSGTGNYVAAQLALAGVPATITAGGNLGSVQVSVESSGGNVVTGSTASVTVTVTGPGNYSQAVPATAAAGLATVNLSSLTLTAGGVYTVTATSNGLTSATATVTVLDFTLALASGSSATQTVTATAGASATYNFSVTPGTGGFAQAVSFTATGGPSGATYSFSPASVTPGSAEVSTTLTVQASTGITALHLENGFGSGLSGVALGLLLLPLAASRRLRRAARRMPMPALLLGVLSLGAVCGLSGCGSSGPKTPAAQTYTITVTGTSGSLSHTTTVTLIVQ